MLVQRSSSLKSLRLGDAAMKLVRKLLSEAVMPEIEHIEVEGRIRVGDADTLLDWCKTLPALSSVDFTCASIDVPSRDRATQFIRDIMGLGVTVRTEGISFDIVRNGYRWQIQSDLGSVY